MFGVAFRKTRQRLVQLGPLLGFEGKSGRSRGGELGGHRLTCRDLQTVWCRSASLLRRRAHKARQSLACIAPRRAHAVALGSTAFRRSPRGVITRATRVRAQSNEKIKPSEQWDRRIAYDGPPNH